MNKSLTTLEFNKIIKLLEDFAITDGGKFLCSSLRPDYDKSLIEQNLTKTNLAESLLYKKSAPEFTKTKNIDEIFNRLDLGASANLLELVQVKKLINNTKSLINYSQDEEDNILIDIFKNLIPLPKLQSKLTPIFEDNIEDSASENLFLIRKEIIKAQDNLRDTLNSLINKYAQFLQDNIVTMKNNRYCLPVRNEFKNSIKGIIHATSSSGLTFFIEPISIIEKNNHIEELKLREEEEINRIILDVCNKIRENIALLRNNHLLISELDFIFAKANLSIKLKCTKPKINTKNKIHLKKARHPLIDSKKVVPTTLYLSSNINQMIITGPNTGGKTVTLKTIGLLTAMTQAGLNIPCDADSEITIYDNIFVDIGDEQSIEQNLSTFSSHISNIIKILNSANQSSLILLDELGAGTDPVEGEAIALSILTNLKRRNIMTFATTHYSKIKYYAHTTNGVINAACEFDTTTLSPTYRLMVGVAGKSNAFSIAKQLGISEEIISFAKKSIENNTIKFEDSLLYIDEQKRHLSELKDSIEKKNLDLEKRISLLKEKEANIFDKKDTILEKARREAAKIIENAKSLTDETIRELNKNKSNLTVINLEKSRSKLRNEVKKLNETKNIKVKPINSTIEPSQLKIGTLVHIISYDCDGIVDTLVDSKGNLYVSSGLMKLKVNIKDLRLNTDTQKKVLQNNINVSNSSFNISSEIKLIGFYPDDAIMTLDKYIDDALLANLKNIRIVHGKGSGKLRQAIHNYLKKNKSISSFELAEYGNGDAGVTIATLI